MICVFTAVCEADARWIDQYLAEIERLNLDFVIYLDRCSPATKAKFNHPRCVARYEQDEQVEFREDAKQKIFDLIPKTYHWAMAWDIDETWEKSTPEKLNLPDADVVEAMWVNLWEDDQHLRVDDAMAPKKREKFYNLRNRWKFRDGVTNGPYCVTKQDPVVASVNLVCLHHGLKTLELRQIHKERWDRIYSAALGRNPYGFWDWVLDETITPMIIKNPYL